MKAIFGLLIRRYRIFVFFIWVYALIDLLQNRRYQTFLRPEFGIVLGIALAIFLAFVIAEMARRGRNGLKWHELPRPIILLIPLIFLMNAQGASLDRYTFKKRFTGTQGMTVDMEPAATGRAGTADSSARGPARGDTNPEVVEDVPSSLSPSPNDRRRFSRGQEAVDGQAAPGDAGGPRPTGSNEQPAKVGTGAPGADQDPEDVPAPVNGSHEITIVELYKAPKLYEGKPVTMIGMIDANEDVQRKFGKKTLILYRFMIACCAADAQPVALMVETKSPMKFQAENVWVKVTGRFTLIKDDGKTVPYLRDAALSTIQRPANEYLY